MSDEVRVWAPRASRIEVVVGDQRIAGIPDGGGWWRGPTLPHGASYAFSLDGGPPIPDPRSRWQPDGVNGPSCWIDPGRLAPRSRFRPVALRDAVIYELHVGTFSAAGTFASAVPHLDALVELGVTHVELMPVAQFSGAHGWGYDGVDLYAAHTAYGGPPGLIELIQACHARQLAVIIDVVHNHLGPEGAYLPRFGPYKTDRHRTPWGDAINLDADGSAEVRRFLIDSALAWLRDYGADGLRLDAVHALRDDGEVHFIAELSDAVRALAAELDRPIALIGEYDDHDPRSVTPRAQGGWGLDAHWNDDFHHAVHARLTGETQGYYADFAAPHALAKVLTQGYVLDGGYSPFRRANHGEPYGARSRDHLVAYVQSHDQVGNRALGERLHQLCGLDRAKIAAALLLTAPFVPMLFQGEEWAASTPFCYFAYPESAELRAAIRRGRLDEHGAVGWAATPPDPTDPATRAASLLRWDERGQPGHAEMFAWYRALIALRKATPELRDPAPGSIAVHDDGDCLSIERGRHALVINLSPAPVVCPGEPVLASTASVNPLPPNACAIVRR